MALSPYRWGRAAIVPHLLLLLVGGTVSLSVRADPVIYRVQPLGNNAYEYTYAIKNDVLSGRNVEEVTIFFDIAQYAAISVARPVEAWDELPIQPDPNFSHPVDGFYDVLKLDPGIEPGGSRKGFSVRFTWLGTGTPGAQLFHIVDPRTLDVLHAGYTVLASDEEPVPIPTLSQGSLLLLGILLMVMALGLLVRRPVMLRRTPT